MSSPIVLCNMGFGNHDLVRALEWGFGELGYAVRETKGELSRSSINVLFAASQLKRSQLAEQAPRSIFYNLEQIGGEYRHFIGPQAFTLMRHLPTWDYSTENVNRLRAAGASDVTRIGLGYAPVLDRIKHVAKDIDVLFYGSMNLRREKVMASLQARGLRTVWTRYMESWSDEERDALIARSKVVLNLAYFSQVHAFEEVRVSYLLSNRCAVVSEISELTSMESDMRANICGGTVEELPEICAALCADDNRRQNLADQGYEFFRQREWLRPLSTAIADFEYKYPERAQCILPKVTPPRRVNLGSDRHWRYDHINVDQGPSRGADLALDFGNTLPFGETLATWRFGDVILVEGGVDYILAEHCFQRVSDLAVAMTNCLRWLADGGVLEIQVPFDLSLGAWQDPKTVRAFNENSFRCFEGPNCWYVGWQEHCFQLTSLLHLLDVYGLGLVEKKVPTDEILRMPRAVEGLRLKLVKRALTALEKEEHMRIAPWVE